MDADAIEKHLSVFAASSQGSCDVRIETAPSLGRSISLPNNPGEPKATATLSAPPAVVRRVSSFQIERKQAALHMYQRVFWFAYSLGIIGIFVAFLGLAIDSLSGLVSVGKNTMAIGYFFLSSGVLVLSSCDPKDTNLDAIMRRRPRLHVTIFVLMVVGSSLQLLRGEVLSLTVTPLAVVAIWRKRTIAPCAQIAAFQLLTPLIVVNTSSEPWSLERPYPVFADITSAIGFLLMQAHWWWNNWLRLQHGDARSIQETTAFFEEWYIWLLCFGVFHIVNGLMCPTQFHARPFALHCGSPVSWFPMGLALILPTMMLLAVGRQRWFSFFARRFNCDPKVRAKDALFVASLLDGVHVEVGEEWWCFRDIKDESFPWTDKRRHFRRGITTSVQNMCFVVEFPAAPGQKQETMSVPMAGRGSTMAELAELSKTTLRCMNWEQFSLELLGSGPICGAHDLQLATNQMLKKSRPVLPGERIDFFLSHCWYDDPVAKYELLCDVAASFRDRHGRNPTFWFDKTCIDQTAIADGLRVLPVTINSCDRLIMMFSPQYSQRLWCVWELFTILAFTRLEHVLDRIHLLFLNPGGDDESSEAVEELCNFQACNAKCFDPNDENRLRKVILAVGEDSFNRRIQQLGDMCRRQFDRGHSTCLVDSSSSLRVGGWIAKLLRAQKRSERKTTDENSVGSQEPISPDVVLPTDQVVSEAKPVTDLGVSSEPGFREVTV